MSNTQSFRMRRFRAGLRQAEIGRLLGQTRSSVKYFEKHGATRSETIEKYEAALASLIAARCMEGRSNRQQRANTAPPRAVSRQPALG